MIVERVGNDIRIRFEGNELACDLHIALDCAMSDFQPAGHALSDFEVKAARDFVTELGKITR